MPAKRKKDRINGQHYVWLLGQRGGIWMADGRSNNTNVGRHSLGTKDRQEALKRLVRLDMVKAVEFGKAPRSILDTAEGDLLSLENGNQLYLEHVGRLAILGGAIPKTVKRYRAVLNKFVPFAQSQGVQCWQAVSKSVVQAYGAWLDDHDYEYATEYLELTMIKQMIKWLVTEKLIPASCLFPLQVKKPHGTSTYCYRPEEVQEIIAFCFANVSLIWLGEVITALATTGLRISELADLRWSDIDLKVNMIKLTDTRLHASKAKRAEERTLKSQRDRDLPIHPDLKPLLLAKKRCADGRVFHGPLGGKLKPDTVRNVLVREVLTQLASKFPPIAGDRSFTDGRLHSFRHYFCSVSANSGAPEQVLMTWLGHRDSKMVRHYYHLHQAEAQAQMAKIDFVGQLPQAATAG